MTSYTTNKNLTLPDYNSSSWNTPLNNDFTAIDAALGGVYTLSVAISSTPVVLFSSVYLNLIINLSGTLSNNVTFEFPSGVGGMWFINPTGISAGLGTYTVTFKSVGGGSTVVISTDVINYIYSDGTNVVLISNPLSTGGANTQIQYNNNGTLAGSSKLTFDGTDVTDTQGTFIDNIGQVRAVPINNQSSTYTVVSTDAGKLIVITSGNINLNSGILSVGQNITIFNNSFTPITINQGTGVTIYLVGAGTTGNRSLGQYGITTLLSIATDTYIITGNGIS
jgi:hypothetical protein